MIFAAIIIHNDVSFPTIPFHLAPIDSQDSLELSELIFPTSRSPFSAVVNNPFFRLHSTLHSCPCVMFSVYGSAQSGLIDCFEIAVNNLWECNASIMVWSELRVKFVIFLNTYLSVSNATI